NNLLQRMAGDVFHDHERQAITVEIGGRKLAGVVHRNDVRVAQAGNSLGFTAESIDYHRVAGSIRAQHLHGDLAREDVVGGQIYICHAAAANQRFDLIAVIDQPWQAGRQSFIVAHGASLCSSFAASGDSDAVSEGDSDSSTSSGPAEISKVTVVPGSTSLSAATSCSSTVPATEGSLRSSPLATAKPASWMRFCAASKLMPVTEGTATVSGAMAYVIEMVSPFSTLPVGFSEITSRGSYSLVSCGVESTTRPLPSSSAVTVSISWPTSEAETST